MNTPISDAPQPARPAWAPLTLVAFVGLVICTNIASATFAGLIDAGRTTELLALSSRNRFLALALGADVSPYVYWTVGAARIAVAFIVCHLIGRAYADTALDWFVKFLGVDREGIEQFNTIFDKASWVLIPLFAGSNLVAAISGVQRTAWAKMIPLLLIGVYARLAIFWWLAEQFAGPLKKTVDVVSKYSVPVMIGSIVLVILANLKNFRKGSASS